jgi:hypothetical protein
VTIGAELLAAVVRLSSRHHTLIEALRIHGIVESA